MGKTLKELYGPLHIIMARHTYNGTLYFLPEPLTSKDTKIHHFSDPTQIESVSCTREQEDTTLNTASSASASSSMETTSQAVHKEWKKIQGK